MPVPLSPGSERAPALKELVRQGELALEKQFRMAEDHYRKSRHFMTLTAGLLLVGGLVSGLFLEGAFSSGGVEETFLVAGFLVLLGISFGFGGSAFRFFVRGYGGDRSVQTGLASGWTGQALSQYIKDRQSLEEVLVESVENISKWLEWNSKVLSRIAAMRRKGIHRLWLTGIFLSATLLYSVIVVRV